MEKKQNEIEITPQMLRQMQMVQLEMLIEVDRICSVHHIPYSLDGGTLLGAVRHKGFIPWDDDIDLIMLRDDYERFFQICHEELDHQRFFLQEERTDLHYYVGYPRLRRNGSVYIRAGHEHMKYHTGIFMDIFVLDHVPDKRVWRNIHKKLCFCLQKMLWAESGKRLHGNAFMRMWYTLLSCIPRNVIFWLFHFVKDRCNCTETELVRHMTHPYPDEKACPYGIPRDLLNEFVELEFEGHSFHAVKEYDCYLKMLYGDYWRLPPEEKQKVHIHLSAFAPPKD